MKLTDQQKQLLSKHLQQHLLYRETYTEFYDHILSALETQADHMPFQTAVEQVIENDLGGYEGMRTIERRYKNTISNEVKTKYFSQLADSFKYPNVGITMLTAVALYYITRQPWFNLLVFFGIICVMRIIPAVLGWVRNYKLGYSFFKGQKSVKDGVFEWLSFIPAIILGGIAIINAAKGLSPAIWFGTIDPKVLTAFLLLCTLHMLTFYKLYTVEFKLNIS